ncbi:MAG: long-chain fatty acid--CoA ligase [Spirochaetes bacterium RBG_13_51_14]|nr:MAG: long-chain fatty acid--CoA ligase [Spirochaetes bacterium RBG_13_51_14]
MTYLDKPWLAHYDKGVPANIKYDEKLLVDYLDSAARDYPGKTAFISAQGYEITYADLKDMAYRFATCLADFGIRKGDSVAIHLPNMIQTVAAYFGIIKIGGKVVMNNPLYSAAELEYQFNNSDSKVLITLDLLANNMIDLRPKTKIKQIVYVSLKEYVGPGVDVSTVMGVEPKPAEQVYKWKDLIAKYPPNPPQVTVTLDDVAMLQYTGGTTGVTKGAMLTHGNLSKQLQQIVAWDPVIKRGDNEVYIGALPFFHVYGLSTVLTLSIYFTFTVALVVRPTPEALFDAIKKYKPTVLPLVPTMFIGLLNHPEFGTLDLASVKRIASGSAPLPVEVIKEYSSRSGANVSEGFGMTEASPVTHANPWVGIRKVGSIGLPYPDTLCRIVDLETGEKDVPVGESGELIIKGPQVMKGYWKKPDETKLTLRNGWLYTGDIAKMDEDGYFYIVDRKKDMILSGGFNVYPRDIDEVLFTHPKVLEACAIGVPHPTRGEQIKAFVVLREGQTATQEEIIKFCESKLARYKLPAIVEFRKELPKSNVGKILRKILREEEMKKTQ